MIEPGTLYWYFKNKEEKHIEMLIKTEGVCIKTLSLDREFRYKHTFLLNNGKTFSLHTSTENIEDDPWWNQYYKKVLITDE